mmetsp:Transcript_34276/g.82555  ORF Transcript_34276/g.82555 Transcript_34276/m.82555 type:complete len:132 (+) Transcript_34276:536-931(+)
MLLRQKQRRCTRHLSECFTSKGGQRIESNQEILFFSGGLNNDEQIIIYLFSSITDLSPVCRQEGGKEGVWTQYKHGRSTTICFALTFCCKLAFQKAHTTKTRDGGYQKTDIGGNISLLIYETNVQTNKQCL